MREGEPYDWDGVPKETRLPGPDGEPLDRDFEKCYRELARAGALHGFADKGAALKLAMLAFEAGCKVGRVLN